MGAIFYSLPFFSYALHFWAWNYENSPTARWIAFGIGVLIIVGRYYEDFSDWLVLQHRNAERDKAWEESAKQQKEMDSRLRNEKDAIAAEQKRHEFRQA